MGKSAILLEWRSALKLFADIYLAVQLKPNLIEALIFSGFEEWE